MMEMEATDMRSLSRDERHERRVQVSVNCPNLDLI